MAKYDPSGFAVLTTDEINVQFVKENNIYTAIFQWVTPKGKYHRFKWNTRTVCVSFEAGLYQNKVGIYLHWWRTSVRNVSNTYTFYHFVQFLYILCKFPRHVSVFGCCWSCIDGLLSVIFWSLPFQKIIQRNFFPTSFIGPLL